MFSYGPACHRGRKNFVFWSFLTYLHKKVEHTKKWNDDSHQWCGNQDDNTRAHHVEHRAHEHLNDAGDNWVNGVNLLGKAVDQVAAGCSLKKGHRWAEDVVQHGLVEVAGRQDAPNGHGEGVTKDCHTWHTAVGFTGLDYLYMLSEPQTYREDGSIFLKFTSIAMFKKVSPDFPDWHKTSCSFRFKSRISSTIMFFKKKTKTRLYFLSVGLHCWSNSWSLLWNLIGWVKV